MNIEQDSLFTCAQAHRRHGSTNTETLANIPLARVVRRYGSRTTPGGEENPIRFLVGFAICSVPGSLVTDRVTFVTVNVTLQNPEKAANIDLLHCYASKPPRRGEENRTNLCASAFSAVLYARVTHFREDFLFKRSRPVRIVFSSAYSAYSAVKIFMSFVFFRGNFRFWLRLCRAGPLR